MKDKDLIDCFRCGSETKKGLYCEHCGSETGFIQYSDKIYLICTAIIILMAFGLILSI